jgi:hypothetical protein
LLADSGLVVDIEDEIITVGTFVNVGGCRAGLILCIGDATGTVAIELGMVVMDTG